jgi:transposase
MSLQPQELEPIPELTARIAKASFPQGTLAMRLRDALGPIYHDEQFAHLFPKRGRAAEAPWRLALVLVLQGLEQLTERQAAEAVRGRLDWKYALSLPVDDPGFDHTVLSDFRMRLVEQKAVKLVLEPILTLCRAKGWLAPGGQYRTDSTHVLSAVRRLNSLESVGETLRAVLNAASEVEPDWVRQTVPDSWFDRYVHRFELARFPRGQAALEQLRQQVGEDAWVLLSALQDQSTPAAVRELGVVALLQTVWQQHFERVDQQVRWRDGPAVDSAERIVSPYDVDARCSRKRETDWFGFKSQMTESCCPEEPIHLIVDVDTQLSTTPDVEQTAPTLQRVREQGLDPKKMLVDSGYMSGPLLVQEGEQGTELVGPVLPDPSRQSREHKGFAAADFEVDWQQQQARCPAGLPSVQWKASTDKRGQPTITVIFARETCQACALRAECTTSCKQGRTLTLPPEPVARALQERRQEQSSPAFQQQYAQRAGIEATLSQAVRRHDLRKTPYRGLEKTHLHHVCIASGINLVRIDTFLQAQAQGKPARPARPPSPFARLRIAA